MLNNSVREHKGSAISIRPHTIVAFSLTLALCLAMVFALVLNRSKVEKLTMDQLIMEKSIKISEVMSKLLYKTQILASLIMQNNGELEDFDQLAATIVDDPAILNILIAPNGVVSEVYPLEGNEAVVGLDFFSDGAGNKEALLAKESGQLVMGGPFDAVQGSQVIVGRLPVYINEPDGSRRFWGLVSVTLKYPQALDGAGLSELRMQDFAFEIWRISPDNGERQIISSSGHDYSITTNFVERPLTIANAEWFFRILPVRAWYEFPETWIAVVISLFVSVLIAAVVQNNQDLKSMKKVLTTLSNTDPLVGIHNRRHFLSMVKREMDRVSRTGGESYIFMLDLDHFKSVNDKYGHQHGDSVLKEIAARVSNDLRTYDLFARYGGEEFIIFACELDKNSAIKLGERIRKCIADTPITVKNDEIHITISIGIAYAAPVNDLDTAIAHADKALYKAKEEGRNRTLFYNEKHK